MRNPLSSTIRQATLLALILAGLALSSNMLTAQTTTPQEKPVKHYALIFHTTPRSFTPEQLRQRAADIAAWVQHASEIGVTLDPRAFGATVLSIPVDGSVATAHTGPIDPTFGNIVFFDSTEEQAVEVVRSHPGPHYGSAVDLREWTDPRIHR